MNKSDKRSLLLILFTSIANGVFSVIGIASILPFIGIISEPELFDSNEYIAVFKDITGIATYQGLVISFGIISFVLIVLANFLNSMDSWIATKFGFQKERVLSKKLLGIYLQDDVLSFSKRNDSHRAKSILADVDRVILDSLFAMLEMVSGVTVAIFIFILLLVVNPQATLVIMISLLLIYALIYLFISKKLDSLGKIFSDQEAEIYSEVLEALKLQREIKLSRSKKYFLNRYSASFEKLVNSRLKYEFISLLPQPLIETIAFACILTIAIYFSLVEQGGAVTMIGVYAFSAYRLMPAISDVFSSVEVIQFGSAILEDLTDDFHKYEDEQKESIENSVFFNNIELKNNLELKDVVFKYGGKNNFQIKQLSLKFNVNNFYCLQGKTGCGKSTVLNMVAGLYKPTSGKILIDGEEAEVFQKQSWFSKVGYVPTKINIINVSILENIALGIDPSKINHRQVKIVARLVDLDRHICSLSKGYHSVLGEDGLSFSSGQIQKIGIARALYRKPELLLLDEATDALDEKTEAFVLRNIKKFCPTVIFISHRNSVHEFADQLVNLEEMLVAKV